MKAGEARRTAPRDGRAPGDGGKGPETAEGGKAQAARAPRDYLSEDRAAHFLDRNLWLRLGRMMKPHKALAIACLLLLLVAEVIPLAQPKLLQSLIDGPIRNRDLEGVWVYMALFLGLVVLGAGLEYARSLSSQMLGLRIIHEFRVEVFRKVLRYHMDFFHRTPVGRLMTRLGNDIDALNSMFTEGLVDLLGALLLLFYATLFMLFMDWRLALATLVAMPPMVYATAVFRRQVRATNGVIRQRVAELNSNMQESLGGIKVVQVFGKGLERFLAFDSTNARCRDAWFDNVKCYSLYFPVVAGLSEISLALLFLVGAGLFYAGEASVGTLVAFSWYAGSFFRPLREISDKITALQTALSAAERVFTLYDRDALLPEGGKAEPFEKARLEFERVEFAYEEGNPVLKQVSFTAEEGKTLAIVGATGSGKSTIISLCNRFYLPAAGRILLGGTPLADYTDAALRRRMAYISQDVHLFAETIAFNVALSPHFDLERVEAICRAVHAHAFIEKLPEGYLTPIREKGENLSAGQRQLLAFARALYQNPALILLDEATSSVDAETEGLVQDALVRLTRSTTSIIVAHRLSTIQRADRILVMHKGQVREAGTHQELLRQGGIYLKLYETQNFS